MGGQSAFKATTAPGDARRLATEAVADGFEFIVAAGGDGTVNEVLNGLGDAPNGFARARFGVLPLGTINVFARELKIPLKYDRAWEVLRRGHEVKIDLPCVEFTDAGKTERRYFVQLAGAGFDARAIELVDFSVKKKIGPMAYIIAGVRALSETKPKITVHADGASIAGELILVGNGKYYGGSYELLPGASWHDGQLDVCVWPRVDLSTVLRCLPNFLLHQKLPEKIVRRVRTAHFELSSDTKAAFELDGEWIGHLPAKFSVERARLRVAVP
jgi:YegS/Rv2252/BmrU family lipid kinase